MDRHPYSGVPRRGGAGGGRGAWWRLLLGGAVWLALAGAAAAEPDDETPVEADVASAAAGVLDGAHLLHLPVDPALSSRFLDGYLDTLDGQHLVLLQSDVDEFGWFRPDLARMTATAGDTWAAHVIFARYLKRLAAQVDFATNLLQTANFEFDGSETWPTDRRELPRPRDLAAAEALWRDQVRADYLQEKLAGRPPAGVVARLTRRYERRLQMAREFNYDEVLEFYLDAYAHAFDPHSDYFGHQEAREFNSELNLSVAGIGGSLEAKGGNWVVGSLVPGGPAARSGRLHPGDRIVAVAQGDGEPEEVTDLPSWRVVNLLRGPEGSAVSLTIVPAGRRSSARETVSLVRENVKLADERARAALIDLPSGHGAPGRLGVINLPLFYGLGDTNVAGATADTARLIQKLKQAGATGLIVDLRRNPGGSLEEAVKFTGLFIPAGPVVQTRNSKGTLEVLRSPESNALYTGPLVVLTSRYSASSSEIVAGALQDYRRAVVVGDSSTFGKGTVQTLVPLESLLHRAGAGSVKVTVAKLYRPGGDSTQAKGVVPDMILPSLTDLPSVGEVRLPNALAWDTTPAAAYARFDLVQPVLAGLREKSQARVAADPWFQLVREELAALAAENGNAASLNESVRRQELERSGRLGEAWHKLAAADAARAGSGFEITFVNGAELSMTSSTNAIDDGELREAENILADYIQALPTAASAALARPPMGHAGAMTWEAGDAPGLKGRSGT